MIILFIESGKKIQGNIINKLNNLKKLGYEIGIVGGGKLDKILQQLDNKIYFDHYFSEYGHVYYKNINFYENYLNLEKIYIKNIREHYLYNKINILIKCIKFFIKY